MAFFLVLIGALPAVNPVSGTQLHSSVLNACIRSKQITESRHTGHCHANLETAFRKHGARKLRGCAWQVAWW